MGAIYIAEPHLHTHTHINSLRWPFLVKVECCKQVMGQLRKHILIREGKICNVFAEVASLLYLKDIKKAKMARAKEVL